MRSFDANHKSLCGLLSRAVGSSAKLILCSLGNNSLCGPIPQALECKLRFENVVVWHACILCV